MSAKAILVFCAQALLVQGIYSQCAGIAGPTFAAEDYIVNSALPYGAGLGLGLGAASAYLPSGYGGSFGFAPSSGGSFVVTSTSPITPYGITVVSENAIEGALSVIGELPFLGAVALDGTLPTAGSGGINYGCGDGAIGIVSEGIAAPATPAYPAYGPAGYAGGVPYGASLAGYGGRGYSLGGCGCGAVY